MLVLTRQIGEEIVAITESGEEVRFVVLGNKRYGVKTARETKVHRKEVYDRIKQERGAA